MQSELTSCPLQLARQNAVSIDQILTRRSSEPVITYLPERSNIAREIQAIVILVNRQKGNETHTSKEMETVERKKFSKFHHNSVITLIAG